MTPAAHDMSMLGLFLQAHWIVKATMIGLVLMSVWSWAVIIEKMTLFRALFARAARFEESFWASTSLDQLYDRVAKRAADPMVAAFAAGMEEWRRGVGSVGQLSRQAELRASLKSRIDGAMGLAINRSMERVERRLPLLASIASAAPFIGLFGTVIGIMNSFLGIAEANNTSLAVVAPGIAEALFATAIGLVAAIPASLAYNKFVGDLSRYSDRLNNFATELSNILSRHMEEAA